MALIDSGASSTMISSRVVGTLGLEPVSKKAYAALGGRIYRDAYLFHVAFYGDDAAGSAAGVERIHVCSQVIHGGEVDDGLSFDVLLGMDVITTGTLVIDRDGRFSFSY